MNPSQVAVIKTSPETVFGDYYRLMHLVSYNDVIIQDSETVLNIDLSWHHFTPGCSTPPWQLDGVLRTLVCDGYDPERLVACFGKKRGIDSKKGQILNRHHQVIERHGIRNVHLADEQEWKPFEPKNSLHVLPGIFPDGIVLPVQIMGKNVIHLSTMKTDTMTTVAGALYTVFEGLLDERKTDAYSHIHEALVDSLAVGKETCSGMLAVMDGVFAGEGSNPRCPLPHEKNIILASQDPVALDVVAASMMGFDPMSIPFIRLAHGAGLGTGDIDTIELLGDTIEGMKFQFRIDDTSLDASMRRREATKRGKPPWALSRMLSLLYHDVYWFYSKREDLVREFKKGDWGKLFESYRKRVDM